MDDEFRVDVTDDDIRAAKRAWARARDDNAPADRVELLWGDLMRLWRAQAKQIAEDFQRRMA